MNHFSLSRLQGLSRTLVALIATGAVFTAGCANMATTATGSSSLNPDASISGNIHGGNEPVAGATVTLWYAGQGGAGSAAIGATTTSSTDGRGAFHFVKASSPTTPSGNTYVCPSSDPLVYLVATGGDTVNSTDSTNASSNSASVFLAPLGDCNSIGAGTFINMSEVNTVATMAALQQYFDPSTETFYTDGTGIAKRAMTNAFSTIPNLVNLATGLAITSQTISPASVGLGHTGTSVTATPESAKVNTLANILSSCINNASLPAANCTTLFSNAVSPDPATTSRPSGTTFSAPTDVLQALYYILTNPTNGSTTNLTNLYNLSSAVGAPYQPVLSSAPSDWTIAIAYSSTSTCNNGHLIHSAQDLAVDTFGNIWIANNETNGNLSALSPSGAPVTCAAVGSGANTGITIDSLAGVGNVSDIWLADNGSSNVYRYNPSSGLILPFPTATAPTSLPPLSIAADGSGNVYFTSPTDTTLYEIPGAVAATAAVAPVAISTSIGPSPAHIMVDNTPAIWTTSGSSFITRTTVSSPITGTGASSVQISAPSPSYGITVTAIPFGSTKDFVYVSSDGTNNFVDQFQGIGTSYSADTNWPTAGGSTPAEVASDGAQNVWTVDNAANAVVEVGANLQALSPSGGFQKSTSYLGSGRAIVIDGSGNVWIGLDGVNAIAEIVGAAVPVYQPYATALKTGYFQTIP